MQLPIFPIPTECFQAPKCSAVTGMMPFASGIAEGTNISGVVQGIESK